MPFQIICARNKGFWSKIITALCGFTRVITAMAVVFPITPADNTTVQPQTETISTITTTETEENQNA